MNPLWLKGGPIAAKKAKKLSDEQVSELHQVFETFDTQKRGSISYRALKVALRAMDLPVKKAEVLQLLERHNEGDKSSIGLPAFQAICAEKIHAGSPGEEYRLAFQLLSYQATGVSANSLQECADALGIVLSEDEAAEMVAEFDQDQDGVLNEQEFAAISKVVERF